MVPKRQTKDVKKHVYRLYSMAFTKSYCDLLPWVKEKTSGFNNIFFSLFLISICIIICIIIWCPVNLWCLLFESGNDFILFIIQQFVDLSLLENSVLNKRKLTRTACEVIFFEVQNKHIFLMI